MEIAIVLTLFVIAIILFSIEIISPDIVALMILVVLVSTNILSPKQAFAGFGEDFIVMLASIFVISAALQSNGIIDHMGNKLIKMQEKNTSVPMLIFFIMFVSGAMSAFMNNTTIAAIFLPPIVSISRKLNISPSKLLMPMAFAALLGGTCTLIGTSTNVAGSAYMSKSGMEPMHMFELLPLGLIAFAVGIVFMVTIGQKLLPNHMEGSYTEEYDIRKYLSELSVAATSPLIGQIVFHSQLSFMNLRVLRIIREGETIFPDQSTVFETGDVLIVEGSKENISKAIKELKISIIEDALDDKDLENASVKLAELVIMPQSVLANSTLTDVEFRKKFNLSVLAIHSRNENIIQNIGNEKLHVGDVLLVQGNQDSINVLKKNKGLIVLTEADTINQAKLRKGWMTLAFFVIAILLGSFEVIPQSVAFVGAALLTVLTGCLEGEKMYSAIDWRLLVLIAGMTAFGAAMKETKTDEYIVNLVIDYLSPLGVTSVLFGFMLLTVILTQPMTNAAAAMVVLPLAIQTAKAMQVNERTFAIAVIVSASISMVAPFEPACLLVYGPGKYRILDFIKIGGLLTCILLTIMLLVVPMIWKL